MRESEEGGKGGKGERSEKYIKGTRQNGSKQGQYGDRRLPNELLREASSKKVWTDKECGEASVCTYACM